MTTKETASKSQGETTPFSGCCNAPEGGAMRKKMLRMMELCLGESEDDESEASADSQKPGCC